VDANFPEEAEKSAESGTIGAAAQPQISTNAFAADRFFIAAAAAREQKDEELLAESRRS